MRIFIITMDDPVQTNDFIKNIINEFENDIVGLAVPSGGRLTISKGKSKYTYLFSLFLIMGPFHFLKNALVSLKHKLSKKLASLGWISDPSIVGYAKSKNIETRYIKSPNNTKFLDYLESLNLDIIINQSQSMLKQKLLKIPKIGGV